MDSTDVSWTDDLCCDEALALEEAPVHDGRVRVGQEVTFLAGAQPEDDVKEAAYAAGDTGVVLAIAAGFKGKAPFRKRLWVMFWVKPAQGSEPVRVPADRLAPVSA